MCGCGMLKKMLISICFLVIAALWRVVISPQMVVWISDCNVLVLAKVFECFWFCWFISNSWALEGKSICTGSDDQSLRIWNPKTGQSIHVVRGICSVFSCCTPPFFTKNYCMYLYIHVPSIFFYPYSFTECCLTSWLCHLVFYTFDN